MRLLKQCVINAPRQTGVKVSRDIYELTTQRVALHFTTPHFSNNFGQKQRVLPPKLTPYSVTQNNQN